MVMRAATGRAAPGSGNDAPAAETVVAVTASSPSGVVHTATSFAGRPDRCADQDVTVLALDGAMTADPQDRKAHHLIAPRPIPAPPFFLPAAHVSIHSASAALTVRICTR